ncbi:TIGR03943 family protein [Cohnella sp. CFH 77786]|uniref:TIGR03943 family putative permease subunit n=1 Tax=Cohnella sp. CFH 77786 TaxID=2662265 RepID=UPI001C60A4DC|nr:TIGR03943 family protein [Cohnella sp. CFH 77786]MBW5445473.1 TIGR03943 family protein [Cohnella sp. CFH 77786]
MSRFMILFGFTLMFSFIHLQGNLNKYINMRYSYLSVIAIVLFAVLSLVEFIRFYRAESEAEKRKAEEAGLEDGTNGHDRAHDRLSGPDHHDHHEHHELHDHHDHHDHLDHHDYHDHHEHHKHHKHHDHHDHGDLDFGHDHSHESPSRWKRGLSYAILFVPILTGVFLPVATLDSSFVKAKGFSFPQIDISADNPGQHQFLRPDTSVYYGKEGYAEVKNKDYAEFKDLSEVHLTDDNYLKGMEVIYNFPSSFMGRSISFDGFAYKGEQADNNHYFVFRFGFIHCAADSGVFGMLVDFPNGTVLANDQWVHVTGTLSSELYQPFKQTIPVLRVTEWKTIPAPKDPYVYRNY